jgi:hypothetical protein
MAKYETHERGRSADDGRFMPADKARDRKDAVVETYKVGKNGPRN